MLQNNAELKSKIAELWNKFWSGGISNPLTAIEQITYLLFMKRLDQQDTEQQANAEFTGEKFQSKFEGKWIPPEYRDKKDVENFAIPKKQLRWSYFKHLAADEMLQHVQSKVFPYLKDLNGAESNFTHHMKNAVFIIPKASLLVEAVKTVDEIFALMEKDTQSFQDIQGDVYEYLLSEIASAGKNGQFRTPRHIIKLLAELVQPQLGHKVCDPACGTSGFLLGAYQYIITQLALNPSNKDINPAKIKPDEDGFLRTSSAASLDEKVKDILEQTLYGYDIDSTMVRLGIMNLMMHGIDEPKIDYQDTLSKSFSEKSCYDIVMANPPFTGSIDKGDINEELKLNTTKTELLFLENIYRLLRIGGTAGVIIPQGVLFGSGKAFKEIRKLLIERCELKAVIAMPSGVFKPYAGVSTAILIFTKAMDADAKVNEPATKQVWFYNMTDDGYTLDDKRHKKEGYGDLQDIVKHYDQREKQKKWDRTQKHFAVLCKEIIAEGYDLSFSRYKEEVYEEIEYQPPADILETLLKAEIGNTSKTIAKKIDGGIVKELFELKEMINEES